jgi:quinol monooxygenase YgiN
MIHQIAEYEIKEEDIDKAKIIINDYVSKIRENESDTLVYRSMNNKLEKTKFIHYMIFKDSTAREVHRNTLWVKIFISKIHPLCKTVPKVSELEVISEKY